jgi:hypothetical protein
LSCSSDDEGWNLRKGGGGEEIVIVDVAGNMRWIMVLVRGRIEGFKGDMWVHRWWLGQ